MGTILLSQIFNPIIVPFLVEVFNSSISKKINIKKFFFIMWPK